MQAFTGQPLFLSHNPVSHNSVSKHWSELKAFTSVGKITNFVDHQLLRKGTPQSHNLYASSPKLVHSSMSEMLHDTKWLGFQVCILFLYHSVIMCCLVHIIHYGCSPTYLMEPFSESMPSDHAAGFSHLPPHQQTTVYHGSAQSSASMRVHMQVFQPVTYFLTTYAPWLIASSSKNC